MSSRILPSAAFGIVVAIALGLAAAILFIIYPEIDLAFSALFTDAAGKFHHGETPTVRFARETFNFLFAAYCVTAVAGLAGALFLSRRLFGQGRREWLYLVLCAITGPGVVTNLLFKDHWGRARPVQIEEFGGDLSFSPALFFSEQCERNCSFVSGEASSIYLMFFALAMLLPPSRTRLMLSGIFLGSVAGLIRIAAGGHFLSDVIFAGIFMALTAQILYVLMLSRS